MTTSNGVAFRENYVTVTDIELNSWMGLNEFTTFENRFKSNSH
jgi:hypothetical protein